MGQILRDLSRLTLWAACGLFPLSGLLGGLALGLSLLLHWGWGEPMQRKVLTRHERCLGLIVVVGSLLTGLGAQEPLRHYAGWVTHYGLPLGVMMLLMRRQIFAIPWLKALAIGGLWLAVIAWGNYFCGWTLLWQWGQLPWFDRPYLLDLHLMYHFGRARGLAMHPNIVGCLLAMTLPLLLAWWQTGSRRLRWVLAGGIFLTLLSLAVTFSRGAWMAAAMILGVWAWQQRHWRYGLGLLGLIALLSMTGVAPLLWQHVQTLWQGDYHSNLSRLQVWASGVAMLRDYGWFGMGILHFETLYPHYAMTTEPMAHLHSLYLQILVESGIGVGGLLGGLVLVLSRHQALALEWQPWQQATGLSLAALGIFGWVDYPLADGRVLFMATSLAVIWLLWRNGPEVLKTKPTNDTHAQSHHQR